MNIGILSMQRVKNWGSFLQSYALKKTIEELGHECSFLDIKPGVGMDKNVLMDLNKRRPIKTTIDRICRFLYYTLTGQIVTRLKAQIFHKKFATRYQREFLPMLGITPDEYEDNKSFDIVVIGSDEVFNCTQQSLWCRTLHLFGDEINAKKIVTYAASFGYTTIDLLEKYGLKSHVKKALENIANISVRDDNSFATIKSLTGKSPEIEVDPVLIYDFTSHMPPTVPEKDYLIVYTYYGRISDPSTIQAIKGYAKSKNKKIISFSYYGWCDKCIIPETPFELLAYFKNSDYVVTDTFHGTVFSMKYNRNFCTLVRDSNRQKLKSLLSQFQLSYRIAQGPSDIQRLLDEKIDFRKTNSIIENEIKKAKDYLERVLGLQQDMNAK